MGNNADRLWKSIAPKLRRLQGIDMTPEELDAEAEELLNKEPLSEEEIELVVGRVLGAEGEVEITPDLAWMKGIDTNAVNESMLQLNRNRGQADQTVENKLKQLRQYALEHDTDASDASTDVEDD